MIIAQRRLSTLTQYLTWFGKSPTSTGEINIIRDRGRIQHTEEDHIYSNPISHCYIGQQSCWWQPFSFFLSSSLFCSCSLSLWCTLGVYFIGFNDISSCSFVNNDGCQTYQTLTLDNGCWLPPTTHHCSLLLWQCHGAANAAPATLFDSHMDNGSHIIGNIPTGMIPVVRLSFITMTQNKMLNTKLTIKALSVSWFLHDGTSWFSNILSTYNSSSCSSFLSFFL